MLKWLPTYHKVKKNGTLFIVKIYRTHCSVKRKEKKTGSNMSMNFPQQLTCILHINVFNIAIFVLEDAITMDEAQ